MTNLKYLIGLDLRTTRVKAILFSDNGEIVASADAHYPLEHPSNNTAEQDQEEWLRASCKAIGSVIDRSGVTPEDIMALGIAGQDA